MDVVELEKEVKKIRSGNVTFENDRIVAGESRLPISLQGVPNGWGAIMLAGVLKRDYYFQCSRSVNHEYKEAAQVLACVGKKCRLRQLPDAEVVLRRNGMGNPLILVLVREVNQLHLTIYTAKSAMAAANCNLTLQAYMRHLPDGITLVKMNKEERKQYKQMQKQQEIEQKQQAKSKKQQKKAEDELQKDQRKIQREQKRMQKEQEKRKKELQRRQKALERQRQELELRQQELEMLKELQDEENQPKEGIEPVQQDGQ